MDSIDFIKAISGVAQARIEERPYRVRLATVDPNYDFSSLYPTEMQRARVTFDGETVLGLKEYAMAGGFVLVPGQRVWMLPVGNTYMIGGTVNPETFQGFIVGDDAGGPGEVFPGIELGDGFYIDTDSAHMPRDVLLEGAGVEVLLDSPPRCHLVLTSNVSIGNDPSLNGTTISWTDANAYQRDPFDMHDQAGAPTRITIQLLSAGFYQVDACLTWAPNGTGERFAQILLNGNEMTNVVASPLTGLLSAVQTSRPLIVTPGDYVEIQAIQNSGGALDLVAGLTWVMVRRLCEA